MSGTDAPWGDGGSVAAPLTRGVSTTPSPRLLGRRYEPRGRAGSGGMGVVDIVHDRLLGRDVAYKLVTDGEDARLAHEAEVTARLEHPGIVPVFDAGEDEHGRRFYTMRLVRGRSLAEALRAGDPPLSHVRTLLAAANAVAYAHSVGVAHRDLKPSNILIGHFGEVQVVDWGIARRIGEPGRPEGTATFSAPEQLAGQTVAAVHDVVALGNCLATLVEPGQADDLVAVAERARAGGYADARAFAAELDAWLDGRRVQAHDYTARELLVRTVRAFRTPLAVGGIALLALTTLGAWTLQVTRSERDRAQAAEDEARAHLSELLAAQAVAAFDDGDVARAELAAAEALEHAHDPRAIGVLAALASGVQWVSDAPLPCPTPSLLDDGHLLCLAPDHAELLDSSTLQRVVRFDVADIKQVVPVGDQYAVVRVHDGPDELAWFDDSGSRLGGWMPVPLASYSRGGPRLLLQHPERAAWALPGGPLTPWDPCPDNLRIERGRPRFDGDRVLLSCRKELAWGDVPALDSRQDLGKADIADAVWFAGEPVVAQYDASVHRLSDNGRRWSRQLPAGTARFLASNESFVAVGPERGGVVLLDGRSGQTVATWPTSDSGDVRLAQGQAVTVGNRVAQWALPTPGRPHHVALTGGVTSLDWRHDGLLAIGLDGAIVFLTPDGAVHPHAQAGCGPVKDVAWMADDRLIAVCAPSETGRVMVLDDAGSVLATYAEHPGPRVAPLGNSGISARYAAALVHLDGDGPPNMLRSPDTVVDLTGRIGSDVAWGATRQGHILRITADNVTLHRSSTDAHRVALDADGELLLASSSRAWTEAWAHASDVAITDIAGSPTNDLIAVGHLDGRTEVLDANDGTVHAELSGHGQRVSAVAFSVDGAWLATGSWDGTVRLWSTVTMQTPPERAAVEARWGLKWADLR